MFKTGKTTWEADCHCTKSNRTMFKTDEQLLEEKYNALVNQVTRWNESLTRKIQEFEDLPKSFRKNMVEFSFEIDEVLKENGFQPYLEGSITAQRKQELREELLKTF